MGTPFHLWAKPISQCWLDRQKWVTKHGLQKLSLKEFSEWTSCRGWTVNWYQNKWNYRLTLPEGTVSCEHYRNSTVTVAKTVTEPPETLLQLSPEQAWEDVLCHKKRTACCGQRSATLPPLLILYGRSFLVCSDHVALHWILNFKNLEG